MTLRAVFKTGGKQYLVKEGDILEIEKISGEKGKKVSFKDVFLAFDQKGEKIEIGKPNIKATIEAEILEQKKDPKIQIIKYKPKVRYHRTQGHRQFKTKIKISKINLEKKSTSISKKASKDKNNKQ